MTSTIPNRPADLERRVAELEADLQREATRTRNQAALYKIAALANSADDMQAFYEGIHAILRELVYAENLYVALYDEERRLLNFAYYVDSADTDWPDTHEWLPMDARESKGGTGYILRSGKVHHVGRDDVDRLTASGEIEIVGTVPVDLLGIPLKTDGHTVGVLAVQSYVEGRTYNKADEELMVFVADHIGAALTRTRSATQLRQRNAELAIVNEVGQALAKQLDLTAITELVGARLHETFPDTDLYVALYDAKTNLISFPYEFAKARGRTHTDPIPAEGGLTAKVIHSREPLLVRTGDEAVALGAIIGSVMSQSWLGVPIIAGDELIGVLAVESETKPYAFDESDARLLSTLGASTGVALRNARLFDETKRLLAETQQRNAELAVINEIGVALGKQLDFQAIVDAVGDRLEQILGTDSLSISILDPTGQNILFPYWYEDGARDHDVPPLPVGEGLNWQVIKSGKPLRLATAAEADALGAHWVGSRNESFLAAPIRTGDRILGAVAASDHRANAFSDSDERLLSTLASSMGVALENARLFDETNARAAELAIINSVQEGLAAKLDMDAMYNLVGQKMVEIFDADATDIGLIDAPHDVVQFKFGFEKPVGPLLVTEIPLVGFRRQVYETKAPVVVNHDMLDRIKESGNPLVIQGEVPKSAVFVPLFTGGQVSGVLPPGHGARGSFQRLRRPLAQYPRGQPQRCPR